MWDENERRAIQPTFAIANREIARATETLTLKPRRICTSLAWEDEIICLAIPDVGLLVFVWVRLCIAHLQFHCAELGCQERALDVNVKEEIHRSGHWPVGTKPAFQIAAVIVKLQLQEAYHITRGTRDALTQGQAQRCKDTVVAWRSTRVQLHLSDDLSQAKDEPGRL